MRARFLASLAGIAVALTLSLPPRDAVADEAPVSRESIGDDLHAYYAAEKTTAFVFLGTGAASAAGGAVLITRDPDFSRGLGGALLAVGGIEVLASTFYAFQVSAEESAFSSTLARDPSAFKRDESAHIHGTTSRIFWYRATELALVAGGAGVATYGFVSNRDAFKGIGIGVAAEAAIFFVIDGFGQGRAAEYERRVNAFQPTVAMGIGGGDRPWALGVSGRW